MVGQGRADQRQLLCSCLGTAQTQQLLALAQGVQVLLGVAIASQEVEPTHEVDEERDQPAHAHRGRRPSCNQRRRCAAVAEGQGGAQSGSPVGTVCGYAALRRCALGASRQSQPLQEGSKAPAGT